MYRNVSPFGLVDVVAIGPDGVVHRYDIKSAAENGAETKLSAKQVVAGIKPLHVYRDGTCAIEHDPVPQFAPGPSGCVECGDVFMRINERHRFCSNGCKRFNSGKSRKAKGLTYPKYIDSLPIQVEGEPYKRAVVRKSRHRATIGAGGLPSMWDDLCLSEDQTENIPEG